MQKISSNQSRRLFLKKAGALSLTLSLGKFGLAHEIIDSKRNWKSKAGMPHNLQEIYCSVLDKKIHIAGGFWVKNGDVRISPHHIAYHPKSDTWEVKASIPEPRHHLQMVTHNDILYGFAGFEMQSGQAMWIMHQQTWAYDPKNEAWTSKKVAPVPHAETVAGSIGDHIHIVGGRTPSGKANTSYRDHQDTDHHLVYDPGTDTWDTGAPAPTARNSAAGAVIDGELYVAGGRTVSGGNVAHLEIYDPQEDKWRTAAPMPQAQGGLAAAAVKGKLYAFGGEYFNDGGGVYEACWVYDPTTDKWSATTSMLTPRHGLAGAAIGKTLYALGGAKKASLNQTSNIVEALKPK